MANNYERAIDPAVLGNLRLDHRIPASGCYKALWWDTQTQEKYFQKKYLEQVSYKARNEDLGLTLSRAYGARTPGHILTWDLEIPSIWQRFIPGKTLGDFYRENNLPDEVERTRLLGDLLGRNQTTELMICWMIDYLIYNWDNHPDNYLLTDDRLVGLDKGLTGYWIDHPNLDLEAPIIQANTVKYISGVSKPNNHIMGHVYETVFTNLYRGISGLDSTKIRSVLEQVESLGHVYDKEIRAVLGTRGLEAFKIRRENLEMAVSGLFRILGLEL